MRNAVLACCLFLAGCGGKSGGIPVRIANPGAGLQTSTIPVTLAQSLGYYQEEGLEVVLENLASVAKNMQALLGGSVDAAAVIYVQNIQVAAEGQRVRSFFVMSQRDNKVLAVAPKAMQRIRRVEDLKGAVIGVSSAGSSTHLWLNHVLAGHGVGTTDFSAVGIGVAAPAIAAFESGRVDAVGMGGGDHFYLLRRHPDARILAETTTPGGMRESYGGDTFAGGTLSAKQEWLDRNPDTARRLARAVLRARNWIVTHSAEEIRERLPEGFRSRDAAVDLDIIRSTLGDFYTADGRMPKGAPETIRRYLDATVENVRNARIDLAATWTNEFLPEGK